MTSARATAFACLMLAGVSARAQVVNDGTLGSTGPGLVGHAPNASGGTNYFLTPADGSQVGSNLFHSLSRMDLGSADAAIYQGDSSIHNLITRITGGPSSIDGEVRSEIPGANLFLLNPDGIVFGEHARLNVSGNTVVSTAHEVALGTSGRFDTRAAGGDILTVDPPSAFGFAEPPAPIVLNGSQIRGADSHSLALIAGDLDLSGARSDGQPGLLEARGGRIDLVSVGSSGSVRIVESTPPDLEELAQRGDVSLTDDFVVSSSGVADNPLAPALKPVPGSGPIFVRARNLLVEDSEIRALTVTNQAAGDVDIGLTGDLTVRGTGVQRSVIDSGSGLTVPPPPDQTVTSLFRQVDASIGLIRDFLICGGVVCGVTYLTPAPAGDISIAAHDATLENGGQLVSRSEFVASSGDLSLELGGDLTIRGFAADGNRSGLFSNAVGSGNQGRIALHMPDGALAMSDTGVIVIENGEASTATSAPGHIEIEAASLDMSGNARIDSSTRGAGSGGDLSIDIHGPARLRGATNGDEFTGITTLSQPGSTGDAGRIDFKAGSLEILDGAQISARPVGTGALGNAGSIAIHLADDLVMRRGTISTQSDVAAGGNIDVAIGGIADLRDSAITTSVTHGLASGGNIQLVPKSTAVVLQNSEIVAKADEGAGGNILVSTDALLRDVDSTISASSNFGVNGEVVIDSPQGQIDVEQPELPVPPIDVSSLLREACSMRNPGDASTFVVASDPGPRVLEGDILPAFLSGALPPDDGHADPAASASGPNCR
ncbi:MAG TPA: filamentous hemagglutinin N-terminal domain-containing protein [Myxococcota bacterium]|nr:filamentous hemagglutinin N-terminal domain-containing protein [Myxococcota bacterium]